MQRDQRRVAAVLEPPQRQALVILLAAQGAAGVSRGRALALLEAGDTSPSTTEGSWTPLSWTREMKALRDVLGDEHLSVSADSVALDPATTMSDAVEFRDAILAGDLERAVRLHQGRLVDGLRHPTMPAFDRWLQLQRESLASDAAAALERLAEEAARRGERMAAVHWWRQLAMQYPLNERIAASLMEALVAAGDREGAVRHARFVEALAGERLDLPGDEQVLALARALRTATPERPREAADDDPLAGFRRAIADRYRLEEEVGRGGHGRVLRATDLRHERAVAIKVLHPELAPSQIATRFAREVRVVASLHHPNILPLFESGTVAGTVFYVMPLVEGASLRDRLTSDGALSVRDAVAIARQVAAALAAAHRRGVVHRDIKPENILLVGGDHAGAAGSAEGIRPPDALLTDFGIACALDGATDAGLTGPGMIVGTPAYMSPEQSVPGEAIDGRADVYSLGCVLHEMLTGTPPFTGESSRAILARHASESPPSLQQLRPDVPASLAAVVRRALEKKAEARFPSAADFADALDGAATPHASPLLPSLLRRFARLVVVTLAFLLLVASAALMTDVPREVAPSDTTTSSTNVTPTPARQEELT